MHRTLTLPIAATRLLAAPAGARDAGQDAKRAASVTSARNTWRAVQDIDDAARTAALIERGVGENRGRAPGLPRGCVERRFIPFVDDELVVMGDELHSPRTEDDGQ